MQRWSAWLGGLALVAATVAAGPGCSADPEAESSCSNGVRDGDEVDVDCGGSCGGRCAGADCTDGAECASGKCEAGKCTAPVGTSATGELPPGSSDATKNNGETDVDCGGPNAPPCEDGKTCVADTDCKTGWCKPEANVCVTPRADDGIKNGTETDVDCGGASGVKCAETKACLVDEDCNGACRFDNTCVDAPSCKPKLGGASCGPGEVAVTGALAPGHESCCKSLEVKGFTDPGMPGKTVYLDKYEITAGRIRAFVEFLTAKHAGNLKAWVAANQPRIWSASWNTWLATSPTTDTISVPHKPTSGAETAPWFRNVGLNFTFNQQLFVYVHGHNCGNAANSYGYPTFWYPADVQAANQSLAREDAFDGNGGVYPAKDYLDVKSATCMPNYFLQAFCHWDGGQLATDEVLDFVTNAAPTLGSAAGCGTRCAPTNVINQSGDSGNEGIYNYPYFANAQKSEGTSRIAAPGRVTGDVVRINANDEPWMDIAGNVHEQALDVSGATFTGNFALKYRGIGTSSARAGGNSATGNLQYPEFRAGFAGGRCMRFK